MRRRLVLLNLATTALVVVAFTVPLALLVSQQARDRAQLEAEREAQTLASLVALSAALADQVSPGALSAAVAPLDHGQMIVLPDSSVIGSPAESQGSLTSGAQSRAGPVSGDVEGGWELAIPVIVEEGTIVVSVFVADEELSEGVWEAWLLLAGLGLVIVAASAAVAYRLGRNLVTPMDDLVEASHRLGSGDLSVRVHIAEPEEIAELGQTFNWLAERLQVLLAEEREAVADLSHGLRTPLTSLRLQVEQLPSGADRDDLLAQVDRLEAEINGLIERTRSVDVEPPGTCDAREIVEARAAFWRVLAEDQTRDFDVETSETGAAQLSAEALGAVVDTLVGNVFDHTPPGAAFGLDLGRAGNVIVLEVWDEGPGWPQADILERGVSGAGSTGLGLDIARRSAELSGGSLTLNDRPGGGAVVRVALGAAN